MNNQNNLSPDEIKQHAIKFRSARHNLILVVAFTVINLILFMSSSGIEFLFSAFIPQLFLAYGYAWSIIYSNGAYMVGGVVLAIIFTGVYLFCSIGAKKIRVLILVALIFFAVDTVVFLSIYNSLAGVEFDISLIIRIAISAWIMYYLINGTKAWAKLKGISESELNEIYITLQPGYVPPPVTRGTNGTEHEIPPPPEPPADWIPPELPEPPSEFLSDNMGEMNSSGVIHECENEENK